MKKIILAATFIMISTMVGMAQSTEKVLKMGKWYTNAELGSKTITLSKTTQVKSKFDMELVSDVALSYGQTVKADFVDNEGRLVKAGSYVVDSGYGYKINGNTIVITNQPSTWSYNVKTLQNGDVLLELITPTNKNTK